MMVEHRSYGSLTLLNLVVFSHKVLEVRDDASVQKY